MAPSGLSTKTSPGRVSSESAALAALGPDSLRLVAPGPPGPPPWLRWNCSRHWRMVARSSSLRLPGPPPERSFWNSSMQRSRLTPAVSPPGAA